MRTIEAEQITKTIAQLSKESNYNLGEDVISAYQQSLAEEDSEVAIEVFEQLIENAEIAKTKEVPICQDTGMAVVFLEVGQEVNIVGSDLTEAVNQGVKRGYEEGYLRKSVVSDPLIERNNTNDNTPAVIHTQIVPGSNLKITVAPKGFGSENMSQMKMFTPTAGADKVKEFIVRVVKEAGPNPCPPIVVGVGIGGTVDKAAVLAKKSLLRDIGEHNPDPKYKALEEELLAEINSTGVGPQGLGGKTTALAVNVEEFPTHIAGLPVVVNINCHVARHKTVTL